MVQCIFRKDIKASKTFSSKKTNKLVLLQHTNDEKKNRYFCDKEIELSVCVCLRLTVVESSINVSKKYIEVKTRSANRASLYSF